MNTALLWTIGIGMIYFIFGMIFIGFNIWLFEKFTKFSLKDILFEVQNDALSYIVTGQLIGIGIMVSALMYYVGVTPEFGTKQYGPLIIALETIVGLGIIASLLMQGITAWLFSAVQGEKEILLQNNTALGRIVGAILVVLSMIISVSFFAY